MEDLDNLKTPDAYVRNYGVDVEQNVDDPQYGQITVRFKHNDYQSTNLRMGLEQAKELYAKLEEAILAATYDLGAMWKFVLENYDLYSPSRREWSSNDIAEFICEYHVNGLGGFRKETGTGE